jgi:hypothetical protein
MTMPHLSNCPHDGDGWCIDCVKELWKEKEDYRAMAEKFKDICLIQHNYLIKYDFIDKEFDKTIKEFEEQNG